MLLIYCNNCRKHIYNMYEKPTGVISKNSFKSNMSTTEDCKGGLIECPLCGKYFMNEGRLLTQYGLINPTRDEYWRGLYVDNLNKNKYNATFSFKYINKYLFGLIKKEKVYEKYTTYGFFVDLKSARIYFEENKLNLINRDFGTWFKDIHDIVLSNVDELK